MKNVHILPTDKLSRLRIGDNGNFVFGLMQSAIVSKNDFYTNQHIYITSDEEIKEGDYVCASGGFRFVKTLNKDKARTFKDDGIVSKQNPLSSCHLSNYKKIILTTDLDLDGVQSIDDEFLEWFVKNPSCEYVETYSLGVTNQLTGESGHYKYEIIIPSEENSIEAKQRAKNYMSLKGALEPKQETLEEVIKQYCLQKYGQGYYPDIEKGIEFGAKWQQGQDKNKYSEEEVLDVLRNFYRTFDAMKNPPETSTIPLWFEQFKKK